MKKLMTLLLAALLLLGTCAFAEAPAETPTVGNPGDFIFEAENVDLIYLSGHGWSNEVLGVGLLIRDDYGANASNGYSLGYLYERDNAVEFYINSSAAVEDVTLILRCTMEHKVSSAEITWDQMEITVNGGDPIQYRTLKFNGIPGLLTVKGEMLPFANKTIGKIDLVEGENLITITITNDITMEGTMQATAPIIDCIILRTDADVELTWATDYPMNTEWIEENRADEE